MNALIGSNLLPIASLRRFPARDDVEITAHFVCSMKCAHCMVEGTMDWLRPESIDNLEQILSINLRECRWKGLMLMGSEITRRGGLPEMAGRVARQR